MAVKLYQYKKCSTCVEAIKFLNKNKITFEAIDITEKAPSKKDLNAMLKHYNGEFKKLFNTSGVAYREAKLKDKIKYLSKTEAIELLSANGRLVKRPFILNGPRGLVGFQEKEWKKLFGKA